MDIMLKVEALPAAAKTITAKEGLMELLAMLRESQVSVNHSSSP